MNRRLHRSGRAALALVAAAALLLPAPAAAQSGRDFLFRTPRVTVGLSLGVSAPRAGSDIFDFVRDTFTVATTDFYATSVSGEVAYRLGERFDVAAEIGYAESDVDSEYREWVGDDDLPIRQTTTFERRPFTLSVKAYLRDRGRSVSRFAWVPSAWSPWLGVGGGVLWYRWEQAGEFVDRGTLDIVEDRLESEGTTGLLRVMGGVDVSLSERAVLTGALRYDWASAPLNEYSYEGFDEIDLAGLQATAGIKLRL